MFITRWIPLVHACLLAERPKKGENRSKISFFTWLTWRSHCSPSHGRLVSGYHCSGAMAYFRWFYTGMWWRRATEAIKWLELIFGLTTTDIGVYWPCTSLSLLKAVLVLTGIIVRYFSDKTQSEWIPSIAAWLGMSFALLCICLTPVDIYATSISGSLVQSKSPIFGNIKLLYMGTKCSRGRESLEKTEYSFYESWLIQ